MNGVTSRLAMRATIAAVVVLVIGVAVWLMNSQGSDGTSGAEGQVPSGDLSDSCHSLHEGHGVMAWNPSSADEMVEADCGWPYEPFLVDAEGGAEDPDLDAPFEPRLYQEVSDAISGLGLGYCAITALPDEPADGFVFGFRYEAAEPGCPGTTATVELVMREHVTRAHRDAAAVALAASSEGSQVLVLGRWSLELDGTDGDRVDQVSEAVVGLGAATVEG